MIPITQELAIQLDDNTIQSEETSLAHFCEFVDYYTRHSNDPLSTAVVCEQQAETLRITEHDATPATIQMLIDTMLDAIEHLEKKWLDEQIQHEDLQQAHHLHLAQMRTKVLKRKQEKTWVKHLYQWSRWIWKRFRHVPQREVVAW